MGWSVMSFTDSRLLLPAKENGRTPVANCMDSRNAEWNFFANLEAFGPMASSPLDRMGISAYYDVLSDNFKELVRAVIDF